MKEPSLKPEFKCEFLTQGMNQNAAEFAESIMSVTNKIMKTQDVMGTVFCFPTSDSNGRKEVLIQYYVYQKEGESEDVN
jgi:hypothetical protein